MIRSSEKVFGSNAGWLFTDAAESLFVVRQLRSCLFFDLLYSKSETLHDQFEITENQDNVWR